MTIAKLNYTGRQKIRKDDIRISMQREQDGVERFSVNLELARYKFPGNARVTIEAYRQTAVMRFDFGSVAYLKPQGSCRLTEFDSSDAVLFRLHVTASSGRNGLLLGRAEQIRPTDPDDLINHRIPLLPVQPADLGDGEVWRVDFGSQVILLVNRNLPDWRQTVSSGAFKAFVYPAVVRQVLTKIVVIEDYVDCDDPDDWRSNWLLFAYSFPGVTSPVPKDHADREEWVDEVAASLANSQSLRQVYEADSDD